MLQYRREKGIELSLKYLKKFDYLVPCYYDLRKHRENETETVVIDTSKEYSEEYLKRALEIHPNVKIIPRIFVHGMQGDVFFLASTQDS